MYQRPTATPDEMRALMAGGHMATLAAALAYCRRMESQDPGRAEAWRNQAHAFREANPPRPKAKRRR